MTLPKNKRINKNEIDSMENAVKDVGIQAIHPDKLEDFAEHMVQKLKKDERKGWRTGSPLEE